MNKHIDKEENLSSSYMIGFIEGVLDWTKRSGKLSVHQEKAVNRAIKFCDRLKNDFDECESCGALLLADNDNATDDAGNHFCAPCYAELAPVMKAEYLEQQKREYGNNSIK